MLYKQFAFTVKGSPPKRGSSLKLIFEDGFERCTLILCWYTHMSTISLTNTENQPNKLINAQKE